MADIAFEPLEDDATEERAAVVTSRGLRVLAGIVASRMDMPDAAGEAASVKPGAAGEAASVKPDAAGEAASVKPGAGFVALTIACDLDAGMPEIFLCISRANAEALVRDLQNAIRTD